MNEYKKIIGAKEYFIEDKNNEINILFFFPRKKKVKAQKLTILKFPLEITKLKGFDKINNIIEINIIKFLFFISKFKL